MTLYRTPSDMRSRYSSRGLRLRSHDGKQKCDVTAPTRKPAVLRSFPAVRQDGALQSKERLFMTKRVPGFQGLFSPSVQQAAGR
jgi:hypothetical protein